MIIRDGENIYRLNVNFPRGSQLVRKLIYSQISIYNGYNIINNR